MNDTKRQVLPAGLWVVATPIGNLDDITPRACRALEDADLILCEDTRRTAALLSALGMKHFTKRLERLDAHTGARKVESWVEHLKEGKSFALVTDAGTPAVSDPGSILVAQAWEAGIQITPLPGASAVLTLLSVAGFNETAFTFRGFFPRKTEDQRKELELAAASSQSQVFVWFESPLRIVEALTTLEGSFPEAQLIVGKELTKFHERFFHGSSVQVAQRVRAEIDSEGSVGEWCFAVHFSKPEPTEVNYELKAQEGSDWVKALRCLFDAGVSASEAAKQVSQHFGTPKRATYEAALQIFGKK